MRKNFFSGVRRHDYGKIGNPGEFAPRRGAKPDRLANSLRFHLVRYFGILALAAKQRASIVPLPPRASTAESCEHRNTAEEQKSAPAITRGLMTRRISPLVFAGMSMRYLHFASHLQLPFETCISDAESLALRVTL